MFRTFRSIGFVCSSFALLAACSSPHMTGESSTGDTESALGRGDGAGRDRVYVLGNERANEVIVFDAPDDGSLREIARVATGGRGSDDGLGSQGALASSHDGQWLLAVNAGSNELSLFRVRGGRLELTDIAPSGGDRPISVAESNGLVYVLNAGATQNVSGFTIDAARGALRPLAGSARALSRAEDVGPAQVSFSPDGDALVVTEKATSTLDSFVVRRDGTLTGARATPSAGDTPFGFAFDPHGTLIVSDAYGGAAGAGAATSYRLDPSATPSVVTGPVADHRGAPCWVAVTPDGRYAYTTNAADGTISGYGIAPDGAIALFADGGTTASTGDGSKPLDLAVDDEGRTLYVLEAGTQSLGAFRIGAGGSLTAVGEVAGLPAHAVGLAASAR